jgi:hypothetical protein
MCNCDEDLKCVPKYKHKYELFDKIVMGLVLTTLIICVSLLLYGVFNPIYLLC